MRAPGRARRGLILLALLAAAISCRAGAAPAPLAAAPATTDTPSRPGPNEEPAPEALSPRWRPEVIDTASRADYLSPSERQVVREINLLRADPAEYGRRFLAPLRPLYQGDHLQYPGETTIVTQEGIAALEDCLRALAAAPPAPPLQPHRGLARAARDQARDQGRSGALGHGGSDRSSPASRISRYGRWDVAIAENIDYGNAEPRRIVTSLLIDDGVPSRGHRRNLLDPTYKLVGVAAGPHPQYDHMCVMDFAAAFK